MGTISLIFIQVLGRQRIAMKTRPKLTSGKQWDRGANPGLWDLEAPSSFQGIAEVGQRIRASVRGSLITFGVITPLRMR